MHPLVILGHADALGAAQTPPGQILGLRAWDCESCFIPQRDRAEFALGRAPSARPADQPLLPCLKLWMAPWQPGDNFDMFFSKHACVSGPSSGGMSPQKVVKSPMHCCCRAALSSADIGAARAEVAAADRSKTVATKHSGMANIPSSFRETDQKSGGSGNRCMQGPSRRHKVGSLPHGDGGEQVSGGTPVG